MTMNKTQTWDSVQNLLSIEGITAEHPNFSKWEDLFKPKSRGSVGEFPMITNEDGTREFYCRYTEKYWSKENTIFQNDEKREQNKSKGYSKEGISLWTKGKKLVESMKSDLYDIMMKETGKITEEDQKLMGELKGKIAASDFNNPTWLDVNIKQPMLAKLEAEKPTKPTRKKK